MSIFSTKRRHFCQYFSTHVLHVKGQNLGPRSGPLCQIFQKKGRHPFHNSAARAAASKPWALLSNSALLCQSVKCRPAPGPYYPAPKSSVSSIGQRSSKFAHAKTRFLLYRDPYSLAPMEGYPPIHIETDTSTSPADYLKLPADKTFRAHLASQDLNSSLTSRRACQVAAASKVGAACGASPPAPCTSAAG